MNKVSDEVLLQRFVSGSVDAFEELIGRYENKVYALSYGILRDYEEARDAVQDAFVSVYRKAVTFRGDSKFSSWLFSICTNVCLMKRRERKQKMNLWWAQGYEELDLNTPNKNEIHVDNAIHTKQLRAGIDQAFGQMPEQYKQVLRLVEIAELEAYRVAQILNLTLPAVKSRIHRGRSEFRRRLLKQRVFKQWLQERKALAKKKENPSHEEKQHKYIRCRRKRRSPQVHH